MNPRHPLHILVAGAIGSGASTLARAIAAEIGASVIEASDLDSPAGDRLARALAARDAHTSTVMAGQVRGWGAALEDGLDLIVFLHVPTPVRLERLRACGRDEAVLAQAASYDAGEAGDRELTRDMDWLNPRTASVLTLVGREDTAQRLTRVLARLGVTPPSPTAPTA